MADTPSPLSPDIAAQIQSLLAQFQPSPALQSAANRRELMAMGFGLLGARKGYEGDALSRAGLLGLQAHDDYIKNQQALTSQNMQLAMPLMKLAMDQQFAKQISDITNNPGSAPTVPGPASAFQQPGGASALMGGAMGGQMPQASQLPTQVTAPASGQQQFDALTKLNMQRVAMGYPDMSAAINARYPAPTALRPNAAAIDRFGNVITPPMPIPPQGSIYNPATKSFQQVPNAEQAIALPTVTKNLAEAATTPQIGVLPGGGQGVTGTRLGALGGANGSYGFLNGIVNGGTQNAPNVSGAPANPVQTKLSPEQTKNSEALGDDLAGYRAQVSKSSTALSQLDEISTALQYFKPGPTLPARAKLAAYANDIPIVGSTLADQLVPNSSTALPAIAAMEKIGVGLTAEQSKVFGSREGQQVIGMIKSAMPNAEMVPGAPQIIVDAMKGMHQWSIDKGVAAQAWVKDPAHNGSLDGFSTAWDTAHPVSSYVGNLPALAAIAKGAPPNSIDRPTSAMPAPNTTQIQYLRSHPQLRSQFDAKFGPGASAQYLGR